MKKPVKIDYPFQGWDFSELAIKWGLYIPEDLPFNHEGEDAIYMKEFIINFILSNEEWVMGKQYTSRFYKTAAKDIRRYCKALSECAGSYSPIWKGYSEVKDDFVLFQMFLPVLGHAWS